MDGTYQNPYNRAHIDSPLSPDTPQSASYRANVNRTKTRKWVEAKTQNYDGDDWGGDDYGDEPAPVPAIPPLRPSGSRQASYTSGRLPSEPPMPAFVPQQQQQQQQQPPAERTRDPGPPPALHIHTQPQSPPVAPAEATPYAAGPDRDAERRSSPQPVHNDLPSRASDRSTPPLSQEPAAAYYAAYDQAQAAQPNVANTSQSGAFDAALAPNLQETIASGRDAHDPRDAPAQPQHLLQEHPQPQSSADPNLTSDAPSPRLEARPARDLDDQTGHVAQPPQFAGYPDSSQIEETKRFSTSPQLPDLARMSMFGDDLFSGSSATRFSTDAPPVPTLTEKSIPEEPTAQQLPQRDQSTSPAITGDAEAQSSAKSIDASPELPTSNMAAAAPQTRASPLPSPSPSPQPAAEPVLAPPKPFRPSLPGNWVSETVTPFDEGSYNDRNPPVNEGSQKALAASSKDTDSDADVGRSASPAVPIASSSPETVHPSAPSPSPKDAAPVVHPVDTVQDDFAPPEVLHRENTLNSIASPSPIKESDKLREEIIRTLSPVRPTHEPTTTSKTEEPSEFDPPTRESTYLHGVYDDYWTGGDDKQTNENLAAVPEQRSPPAVVELMPEIQPLSPRSPLRDVSTDRDYPSIDSRPKRFSWEGGADDSGEDSGKEAASATTKAQPVPVVDVGLAKPGETPSSVSVSEPEADSSVRGGSDLPSRLAETARLNSQDDASQISHQVSQVSSLPRGEDRSSFVAPQPPSPVSVASEATPLAEPKSLSLLDERALGLSTDPTPPPKLVTDDERQGPDASTFPPSPPSPQVPLKIMSFREILELPNAADRISKYDETRQQFAQMDSGLNNWLVNVKAQHPDHANASPMFHGGQVVMPGTPHGLDQASQQAGAGGGGAAPTQQPYYQQYLNASSPTTSSTPGRPLTGTLGGGSHSSTSDFKHSSGQVGAKGKGLLLAAGKAGKGLLSKGKDKLRRDKNDEPPSPTAAAPAAAASPQAPTQPKPDRRSSWALSLGGRSGTRDGGGPPPPQSLSQLQPQRQQQPQQQQQQLQHHQHNRSVSDSAPQIPQPTRVSPFGADVGQESQWQPPHQLHTQQQQQQQRNVAGHQRSDSLADELVSPVSDTHSLLDRDESSDVRKPTVAPVAGDEKIDDWVMVDSQRASAPATGGQVPFAAATGAVASAQAQQTQAQAADRKNSKAESPTRNNSFIGLPPIRRGSTFGLNYTRKAKERFSLDEDEMNDPNDPRSRFPGPSDTNTFGRPPSQQGEERSRRGSGTLVNDAAIASAQARLQGHDTHASDTLGGSSTLGRRNSHDSEEVDVGEDPEKKPIAMAPPAPAQNRTPRAVSEQQPRPMPGTILPEGNPVQHVPPQGWNLQQSHLSAPLLSASRSRQFFTGPSSPGRPPADAQQPAEPQASGPQQQENFVQSPVQETSLRSGPQQPGPQQPNPQQFGPPQPAPGAPSQMGPPQPTPDAPQQFGAQQQPGPQNFGRPDLNQGKPHTQMPPRQKFSETPPSSARRYPGLFSGVAGGPPPPGVQGFQGPGPQHMQQQQPQPPPGAPRKSADLPPNMYQAPLGRQETLLQRTQSGEFQVPGIGPPEDDDRGRGRRSSGFFKEIGERFRSASRDRRASMSEQRGPAPPQALPHQQSSMANEIRPDDVSIISSNATEEAADKKKRRRSSFFMNLRGPKAAAAAEDARDDASSINSSNHMASAPAPQPIGHQDRRRSFFGVPTGPSNLGLPALSRSSTTSNSNTNEAEGSISSQNTSKRRLSAMTGKLFHRSSSNQQEEQHPKPGTSQSMAPSIQSRHSALVNTQPAVPSPLAGPGRQRSDTAGSAPNMNRVMTNASQMEPPPEENRGRRVTGSFLGGLFNRSSSKTREPNAQPQRLPQQNQNQSHMNHPLGHFGPPQGPAGRGAPFQGQQQFPQGPQQFAQDPRQFPQQPGGPPQGPQQFPLGQPGVPRQPGGQGPPVFMQGQQQWQQQGPQGGRPEPQQQPQPGGPNGFAPGQQPWPRQGSDENQSPPPGAPRSVSGQGPQQWAQAQNQPPPFRTQGPPVHPIAGVSPPSRSPASFPDQERGGFQPPAKTSSPDLVPDQGRRVSHPYGPDDVQAPKSPVPEPANQKPPAGPVLVDGQQSLGHFAVKSVPTQGFVQSQEPQQARQTQSPPALQQQVSVSPSSSPEMTSGNRVQPILSREAEQKAPEAEAAPAPVRSDEAQPVVQPSTIASAGGLVVRQTQHPSIRKPTPTDRLSASPQPATAAQNQQGETRGSSQDPSASSSIYPDQAEPQPSLASSTPPASQQQQQQTAPLGSNPVQRVVSVEQGGQKPFEHVALQQNGGAVPVGGQGRGHMMGQGPQGPQGQQSPPQGPQGFAQGPNQGPHGGMGPQGQQSPPQGPQGFAQGPNQGPQGPQGLTQGLPGPQGQLQGPQGPFQGHGQGPPGPGFPQGPMQGPGPYQGQFMGRGQGRGQGPMPGQMQGPGQFMGPSPPPATPPAQPQTSGFRKLFRGKSEQPAQQAQGPRPPLQQQPTQMSQMSQMSQQSQGPRPPLQQQQTQMSQTSQMSQQPPHQQQAEKKKESSGKSLFGAFKRSSKQPEPHGKQSPLPQQMGRGFPPPGAPGSGPQQMMGPQGPFNPQQQPNMQRQMPPHVQQQMMMQNRPPPPPGFQYETPMQGQSQGPQPPQNQQLPQPGAQGTEGPSIIQPTPQQPNMQQPPSDDRKGSPPYLQYQQERVSPENVPVPGQKMPPIQQRGSFGPGPSPGLQQRQSFGPGQGQGMVQGQNFPPNMGRGGPPQAQQFLPHGYREQQYESVPIPRGYAAVHADGSIVDPSPRGMYGSPPARSQGQFQGPVMQQSSPPLQQQQSWQQQPQQLQQQQSFPPAQFQGPQQGHQQGRPQVNQSPPQPGSYVIPPPQNVQQQQQQQQQHQGPSPPQFQQDPKVQTQPQKQQVPPAHRGQSPPQGHQIQAQPMVQQQLQPQPQQQQQSIRPQGSITRKPPGGAAPPQQPSAADQTVKNGVKSVPEPTTPAEGSRLTVNVHKANQDNHDDIYDATPRKQPLERQRTGESQISISSTEEAARKANGAAKKSKAPARVVRVNSTRAELEDTEDERRRTLRLEAQEEKILYDPNEDGPSGGRRKEEAEAPQMSATSYPGMEWNPYANGNYDDWND